MRTIAYLGPEKTNTHFAALKRFGKRNRFVHAPTVEDIFHLVERRRADFGVVPVENSLEGAVAHTLDRFIDFVDSPVRIQGEIEQPIQHYLIIRKGQKLTNIAAVFSHPQALAQCHSWLQKHLPRDVDLHETTSTAEGIEFLLEAKRATFSSKGMSTYGPSFCAAIGRIDLAKNVRERQLDAIKIPQDGENKTRFLIIGLGEALKGKHNKTSIMFALKDKPGALHDALVPFKRHRINLTKIESRPSKRKAWEYLFFIDVEGHVSEPRVQRALKALQRSTASYQLLGSYPIAR